MKSKEELSRENEALRQLLASLSDAVLRISASPDVEAVLNEIAETARVLTGARYAVITSFDDAGQIEDYVTSGFRPDEQREISESRDGMQAFEHLRNLPAPVRLRDLRSYLRSIGLSTEFIAAIAADTFLGMAIRHRNEQMGTFSVAEKESGQEFTREDEKIMALFAAQAGMAIANARAWRDHLRVRADLEALIDTSPTGVVVFDATNGHSVSCYQR